MSLTVAERNALTRLKAALQDDYSDAAFENLCAALLGQLLGVSIAVAKSGFQHGGDSGPSGRQGRRFRIESKKYADRTALSDRELLGEIDHALARDIALEAWILVATRSVSEQLEQALFLKGASLGVPVIVLDWNPNGFASLAALCAFAPEVVETLCSKEAGDLARSLQPIAADAIEKLRRDLQAWALGFESVRSASHRHLSRIWISPRTSAAVFGQDVAGGESHRNKVRRHAVQLVLNDWWNGRSTEDAPAVVVGLDGVGKTWAALSWLVDHLDDQPIVIVVPSSAIVSLGPISVASLKRFLADRLYEVTRVRDPEHWTRRLDQLLERPVNEGPILTVFFDGMNQAPSAPWLGILRTLQDEPFASRVRVVTSTRNHHFTDKLAELRGLVVAAAVAMVDVYDIAPNGEFDQMLGFEGLTRGDLHPDLIPLARTPRLFSLVVKFRDRLVDAGQVTIHRLLWEYGRDTLGARAGRSFTENDWRAWLKEIAKRFRDGATSFTLTTLSETTARPDLTADEVFARLSDIIDGQFAVRGPSGEFVLSPAVVAHSLGSALVAHLDGLNATSIDAVEAELSQWLDPISGLDQRPEILRAAVSILIEQEVSNRSPIAGALVTAWLQTQNIPDEHRNEITRIADKLVEPLLDAVERSGGRAQASAQAAAVEGLCSIPRDNLAALQAIIARARLWPCVIARDIDTVPPEHSEAAARRAKWFIDRIGIDISGPVTVLGVRVVLVDQEHNAPSALIPVLLNGFPLSGAVSVFEAAAFGLAIRGQMEGWDGLKWLCLFNSVDHATAIVAIRDLSADVAARTPEPGINPALAARIAALLLELTGEDVDEERAAALGPWTDRNYSYEKHYLNDPGRSIFPLERRHAETVLSDPSLPLHTRVDRTRDFWIDPAFIAPEAFVLELCAELAKFPVDALDSHLSHNIEDHRFEEFAPVLARCAPDLLADLIRRKLYGFAIRSTAARFKSAMCGTDHLILVDDGAAAAARSLRLEKPDPDPSHDALCASQLIMLELLHEPGAIQVTSLIEANLNPIPFTVGWILQPLSKAEVDSLISRFGAGTSKQRGDLIFLMSLAGCQIGNASWHWISSWALDASFGHREFAFMTLAGADAVRFGHQLLGADWSWSPTQPARINDYGSTAVIAASAGLPFEEIAPRLAPWRLLAAAGARGEVPSEMRFAAAILSSILTVEHVDVPDPGSPLTVHLSDGGNSPPGLSITPQLAESDPGNPMGVLRAALDHEAQVKAGERAARTAIERIRAARLAGANLYLENLHADDFKPLLRIAPEFAEILMEGAAERTIAFRHRVGLAESVFLSLCEALLDVAPEKGATLWRSLRYVLNHHFIGSAQVSELTHIALRAPPSSASNALLKELLTLDQSCNDRNLFDLSIAAALDGRAAWLAQVIADDAASGVSWRCKRAAMLSGLAIGNSLPAADAWPNSEIRTGAEHLKWKAASLRNFEACARHWWSAYLCATDSETAYAAWVLFLRSADRRALVWLRDYRANMSGDAALMNTKSIHLELNRHRLKQAMEKHEDKFEKQFLNRQIIYGIGPWFQSAS